jgi:hypothetical protein
MAKLQRALYRHFASKGVPKGLHCLSLRLTADYSTNPEASRQLPSPEEAYRLTDNSLRHFVLLSDNVLAASVVVKSTVSTPISFCMVCTCCLRRRPGIMQLLSGK